MRILHLEDTLHLFGHGSEIIRKRGIALIERNRYYEEVQSH